MKAFTTKKKSKKYKNILSSSLKNPQNSCKQNLFNDLNINKLQLSPKKSQDELILKKNKIVSNKYHRRINSKIDYNNENITNYENNIGLNSPINKNFTKSKNNKINKKKDDLLFGTNISKKQNKQNNLLSISSSLKYFRNNIINSCPLNNNINNQQNIKKNNNKKINSKSVLYLVNLTNIEETRNTTTINNKSNLIKSRNHNDKENVNQSKNSKPILNKKKQNKKLNSSMDNNIKKNFLNSNKEIAKDKNCPKYNLQRFIYNSNNINSLNNINKYKNLNSSKKSFRNSEKNLGKIKKNKNFNIMSPNSELSSKDSLSLCFSEKNFCNLKDSSKVYQNNNNYTYKNNYSSFIANKNANINNDCEYYRGKNKIQINSNKLNINGFNIINEFDSVEEIHFIFVEINQNKKKYFENNQNL